MAYRDNEIGLQVSKINPLSDIANLGIQTTGNVAFVKHPSDADYIRVKEDVGNDKLFDTIQAVYHSQQDRKSTRLNSSH